MKDISSAALSATVDSFEWIERLINFDTTTKNGNLALFELAQNYLTSHRVRTHTDITTQPGSGALLSTFPDANGQTQGGLIFIGDCDVAPVHEQSWAHDPFTPVLKDGRLYGRGVCSMKGFLGLLLGMVPIIKACRLTHPVHLALRFKGTAHSRWPGCPSTGSAYPLARLIERVEAAGSVVGQPTDMHVVAKERLTGAGAAMLLNADKVTLDSVLAQLMQCEPRKSVESPFSLAWGPGSAASVGRADESIDIAKIARCSVELKRTLLSLSMTQVH